jgi:UDP-N-acetylmuramoyl-tripeptide--D-alanyl-D-alanine ligase
MTRLDLVWVAVIAAGQCYLSGLRLLAYLRYFQQEGYESTRFATWLRWRSLTDPALVLSLVAAFTVVGFPVLTVLVWSGGVIALAMLQPDPRRSGKIRLKLTERAQRVLLIAAAVALGSWLLLLWLQGVDARSALVASAIVLAALPLTLMLANLSLVPLEQDVQRRFAAEAVERVKAIHPFIVGITGSYGKSSTKSMVAHILKFKAPTLAASGSINTYMGVTRHIRENLVPGHQFMVVEMGAYSTGSIRRLCELAPPSAALITAVGDMHLERFGSTEAIVRAKGELAEALPDNGLLIVNADSPGALRIARSTPRRRVLLYGEVSTEDLDTRLTQVAFAKGGTSFVLETRTGPVECFTPLLGRPIIMNLAGAFTLAEAIGIDRTIILAALRTLKPVSNRLEVIEEAGITWIRDAYNSNQFGFRAALEVARALPATRRFLVTPGVIELAAEQFDVNRALSREAASTCDTTVVVAGINRDAFVAGHRDAGREGALVRVATRTEAFAWLKATLQSGDLVILENDLPDVHEASDGLFIPRRGAATPPRPAAQS